MRFVPALWILVLAAQPGAQSAPPRTYANPALQLTFSYPAELVPSASGSGTACSRVLLNAALGTDPNRNASDTASSAASASDRWATLTLSDTVPACIPAQALRKTKIMDRMLSSLAGGPTQVLGLVPMQPPFGYLLLGGHAFLAAAQGQPVSPTGLQPANGDEVLAIIATRVRDHVLVWRMASNDVDLLNRMLASRIDVGTGPPQPLYPGHVGE